MKITITLFLFLLVFGNVIFAQVEVKLPTDDNTTSFTVKNNSDIIRMKQNADGGFYLFGEFGTGTIPITGAGTRLVFSPGKAAFRSGYVDGNQWDNGNVGDYSISMGYNSKATGPVSTAIGWGTISTMHSSVALGYSTNASGNYSTAMGSGTHASGIYSTAFGHGAAASNEASTAMGHATAASGNFSTAMGYQTTASGELSTATGYNTVANGYCSTAMGYQTTASGDYSTAMGHSSAAGGLFSTAMGYQTTASGENSTATGYNTVANGYCSTAMGNNVNTNLKTGSFLIGDYSNASTMYSNYDNEMKMRFVGGIAFYSNSAYTAGVWLQTGWSSWSSLSDSTKKENYAPVDGEYFLKSISKLNLGSWNYKGQDPKIFRHYGPMAQEIFHYFGKDEYGTIGCDTTLATADMDGIMMIALQALEKRTADQRLTINDLRSANEKLLKAKADAEEKNNSLGKEISELKITISGLRLFAEKTECDKKELNERVTKLEEMFEILAEEKLAKK